MASDAGDIDTAALVRQITSAFGSVAREDGVTWHEAEEIDNGATADELARARQLHTDRSWQEVDSNLFRDLPSAIGFLDAKAFRYYLPALMVWCLTSKDAPQSATPDNLIALLGEPKHQRWCDEMLTPEQRRAVAAWVGVELQGWYEKPEATERYWSRIAAPR